MSSKILPKKVVIFDFDGTLADTEGILRNIYRDVAKEKGWAPLDRAKYRKLFTASIWDAALWSRFLPWRLPYLVGESRSRLQQRANSIKLFPGMKKVVTELHQADCELYVLSRNWQSTVQLVMDKNGLGSMVLVLKKPGFFTKHKSVKKLIQQKAYTKDSTWMIGDEVRDIYAAKRAGVLSIAVPWGFQDAATLAKLLPTAIVGKAEDIVGIILKTEGK